MTRQPDDPPRPLPPEDDGLPPLESDYLWDPRAPVDPEVARLEALLAPLRNPAVPSQGRFSSLSTQTPAPTAQPRTRALEMMENRPWLGTVAIAALVLLVLAVAWLLLRDRPGGAGGPPPAVDAPALHAQGDAQPLVERTWVETQADSRELRLGDVGQFTLGAGSRLEVRRLSREETRFYLERGRLEAFVSADAHPRFFQVDTPAARCVDLGCQYTLEVNATGDAEVEVQTGRVAFENEGREVFVPRGARCRATRAGGAGTPRFVDARAELVEALDRFDAARAASAAARLRLCEALLAAAHDAKDGLAVWHLLQDADPEIAQRAHARLHEVAGAVPALASPAHLVPTAADRQAWKAVLEREWW